MGWKFAMLLGLWCLSSAVVDAAELYRWTDADGVTHFSDSKPPEHAEAVELREAPLVGTAATEYTAVARSPSIIMYMTPTCGYCIRADRYFRERGLRYRSIDISASEKNRAAFRQRGGTGTPLIIIDGETVRGFDVPRLDHLLGGR